MTQIVRIDVDLLKSAANPRASAKSASSTFYFVLIITMLLFAIPISAQEESRAGLVIVHGDGSVVTQCIAFAEESIRGADLLARSTLDLSMEASGMGATICRIDGEGCDFPAESCFCQCQGSPCIYWSYWRLGEGEWRYSNIGAGNAVVRAGDVDGWRWGLGTVDKAESPPIITFEEICVERDPVSEPPPALSPTSPIDEAQTDVAATPIPTPTSPQMTAMNSARQPDDPDAAPTPLTAIGLLLGVLVMLPVAALLFVWLRSVRKGRWQ